MRKKQEVRIVVGKGLDCSSSSDKHHHWINDYTMINDVQLKVIRCKFCRRILKFRHFSEDKSRDKSEDKEISRWMKKKEK